MIATTGLAVVAAVCLVAGLTVPACGWREACGICAATRAWAFGVAGVTAAAALWRFL